MNGDRGERQRDGQGERDFESKGWSSGSEGDSTEEDGRSKGEQAGNRDTLTVYRWERGPVGPTTGNSTPRPPTRRGRRAPWGEVGAKGKKIRQQENVGAVTLGVRGNKGGLAAPLPLLHSMVLGVHSGGPAALFVSPHSQGYCSHIFPPAFVFFPCPCLSPWRTRVPVLWVDAEGDFLSSLSLSHADTCSSPAPLSCVPHHFL